MNKRILMYIVVLIISVCFICGVAFSQEPTIQQDIMEEDDVENKDEIIEEIIEVEEEIAPYNFKEYFQEYQVSPNRGLKSYMSYKTITSKSSPQYKLQNQYAYTGEFGIRQVDDRFCIAIGTFSDARVGTYVDLILENGTTIPCIIGDFKSKNHTDTNNIITTHNGCVSEFLVDIKVLYTTSKKMGDISYCKEEWKSPVKTIKVYEKNVFNGGN